MSRERSEKRAAGLAACTRAKRATGLTATEASGRRAVCTRSEHQTKEKGPLSLAAGRVDGLTVAIGLGNSEKLKAMMDGKHSNGLRQQAANTPPWNTMDLFTWQASQLEIVNIEALCAAPPETPSQSTSQTPLSCAVAPPSQHIASHKTAVAVVVPSLAPTFAGSRLS